METFYIQLQEQAMSRRRNLYHQEIILHSQDDQYNQIQDQIEDINQQLTYFPKISRGECGYTKKYMLKQIGYKFEELKVELKKKNQIFKFNGSKKEFFDYSDQGRLYTIKRVLKLRFKCKNNRCPQFSKNSQQESSRKWTSYYGLTLFSMYFDKNQILRYDFKNYGQKCEKCKEYGSGQIIENSMENLIELYSLITRQIILLSHSLKDGIELTSQEKNGKAPQRLLPKDKSRVIRHREDLCQACKDGVCLYFYRQKVYGR